MGFLVLSLLGLGILAAAMWSGESDDGEVADLQDDRLFFDGEEDSDSGGGMDGNGDDGEDTGGGMDGDDDDTGAEVTEDADGTVRVTLGDEETGNVVALQTASEFTDGETFVTTYSTTLALVPEGVDLIDKIEDNEDDLEFLPTLLSDLGVETLATLPQGAVIQMLDDDGFFVSSDTRVDAPEIVVDGGTLTFIRAEGGNDGDGLILTDAETATDLSLPDFPDGTRFDLTTTMAGETLEGGSGNDTLDSTLAGTTLLGAGGNDDLTLNGSGSAFGGDGNDTLDTGPQINDTNGAVLLSGGAGDDVLTGVSEQDFANITLEGGAGNDTLSGEAFVGGLAARGGDGDDVIDIAFEQGRAFGDAGNDTIRASGLSMAEGGAGDDLLIADPSNDLTGENSAGARLTGNEGADSFVIETRVEGQFDRFVNAQMGEITDYTRSEDSIQIQTVDGSFLSGLRFDVSGPDTIVRFDLTLGPETISQSVLVRGVTDLTDADVMLVTS